MGLRTKWRLFCPCPNGQWLELLVAKTQKPAGLVQGCHAILENEARVRDQQLSFVFRRPQCRAKLRKKARTRRERCNLYLQPPPYRLQKTRRLWSARILAKFVHCGACSTRAVNRTNMPKTRVYRRLNISSKSGTAAADEPASYSMAGITVTYSLVHPQRELEYQWLGHEHYLAYHEIELQNAELRTDDRKVDRRRNLRGTFTFVPAGCHAWGWGATAKAPQSYTALYIDPNKLQNEMSALCAGLTNQTRLYFTDCALRSTFHKMRSTLSATTPIEPLYMESLCVAALYELCGSQRAFVETHAAPGQLSAAQERTIRDYVESHLHEDVSLQDLADLLKLSRFHFLRIFENTTRLTPYQYVIARRIDRAQRLLRETGASIAEVATAVGYKDANTFSRAFLRITGGTALRCLKDG
jgi:AraC family transcriptional regulator